MSDSSDMPRRPSMLPPDPREGRRRFGPTLLLVLGLGSVGFVYAYRDSLRPAPAAAATVETPPLPSAVAAIFAPLATISAKPEATPPAPPPPPAWRQVIDAFAAPAPPPMPATRPAATDASRYRLQSIVVGRHGGSCLINGRPCRVGDAIDDATVRSIERDRVVLHVGATDVELRLPTTSAGSVRVTTR